MGNQKYLIAVDLDGTVLTDDKKITTETKTVLRHLIEKGHIVVIATGRSNRVSIDFYHELELTTPLINSNGAVMHHPRNKSWGIHHTPLLHDTALDIVDMSYHFQSENILAAIHDSVLIDQYDQRIIDFYRITDYDDSFKIGTLKEHLTEDPTLMLLYPNVEQVDKITEQLDNVHADVITQRSWGEPYHIIEIMNKQMNKAKAIKRVADEYGIPKDRIMAFGDGSNDLEMIDFAGIGVAMENGIPELKSIAKFTTLSNEEHGVAQFLTDYFNLTKITN